MRRVSCGNPAVLRDAFWMWACCAWILSCHSASAAHRIESVGAADDWAFHGGGADESGFSRLDRIKASNIDKLGLAWSLDLPGETSLEATPLAIGGVLYFTGSYATVYAVDGMTGGLLWKYDPQTWKFNPAKMHFSFGVNRGVAYADGRIFAAALDGRLFALDAKTGKLQWSVETTAPGSLQTITGAPRTFNGKVIIGNGGADFGLRGYVTAYDAATGGQIWRFFTTPGTPEENRDDSAMERAAATWNGEYWKIGTGGAVWDSITYDAEFNRVYLGTGNAGPWDPSVRSPGGGDNLYTASIVALDADTGRYVWHYQLNPSDEWDYDATQRMTVADLKIGSRWRKVLMQAPKNGFFYVIDRESGKLISAGKSAKVNWADHIDLATGRPVEAVGARYDAGSITIWPDATGAHSWQDMSFSPSTGFVYIPHMQMGGHFSKGGEAGPGAVSIGGLVIHGVQADAQDGKAALIAWDPIRQRAAWRAELDTFWNGGVLSTAGGLVFQGAADGWFSAYNASTGKRLWQYDARLGIIAAPISYSVLGKQYISVLVGYGGAAAIGGSLMNVGWKYHVQSRRLLTFALDGSAALPPSPPRDMSIKPVDDPFFEIREADVAAGRALYFGCAICHGRDLVSAGAMAPDLRESLVALNPESFLTVLHDGTLLQNGMPRFETLTREQAMQIYAYIRAGARQALGETHAIRGAK
jgi:quinohemoprotein ethanol dehydrogenase